MTNRKQDLLDNSVVVAASHNEVWISKGRTEIHIEDVLPVEPWNLADELVNHLDQPEHNYIPLGLIGELRRLDWMTTGTQTPRWSPLRFDGVQVTPLIEILVDHQLLDLSQSSLVCTKDEGLYIPAGTAAQDATWAMRLFVSNLFPEWRSKGYAFAASTKMRTVHMDVPQAENAARAVSLLKDEQVPAVVSFADEAISRLHEMPGRLHVIQTFHTETIALPDEHVVWRSRATFPSPNLNFVARPPWESHSWGVGENSQTSRQKAIAEAVERFASGDFRPENRVLARACDLDAPILDPETIAPLSTDQQARWSHLSGYKADEVHVWVRATRIDGSAVYVLAQQAYYPMPSLDVRKPTYLKASSSGVAAFSNDEEAQQRAYRELVERDAFMFTWLTRSSRELIDLRTLPPDCRRLAKAIISRGWRLALVNITQDQCPTVLAVATNDACIVLGAAAGKPHEICLKALSEISSTIISGFDDVEPVAPENVHTTDDHLALYRDQSYRRYASFLTASDQQIRFDELQVGSYGPSPKAVFMRLGNTYPGVEDIRVWRCIDPQLIPMTFGYDTEPLGHFRVRDLVDSSQPLLPHPFP